MKIQFLGAAEEVTGSRHYVEAAPGGNACRFLVDCGMFQGARDADERNLAPLAVDPALLDFVILTHAHIDHSGWLPRLCAQGFDKKIHCTRLTADLLEVLLMDSAHLQSADLQRALERKALGRWRGPLPEPLYSIDDVAQCLGQLEIHDYKKPFAPTLGIEAVFEDAGHILGSAIAILKISEGAKEARNQQTKTVVFTGDLGMRNRPIMHDPTRVAHADALIVESTYGDRLHKSRQETEQELTDVVVSTLARGGNVVMPAFAVGRTQEVVFLLLGLIRAGRIPALSIFVDSPMATAASRITERHLGRLDPESQQLHAWARKNPDLARLRYITDVNDSKALNQIKGGAVILSASGMCEAGRIIHHLLWNLPRPQCSVVITGFQAAGTRGRQLVDGAKTIRLFGQDVQVKASVHTLGGLSAHADQADLLWWLRGFESPPQQVFVVHGEPKASAIFSDAMANTLGWKHITSPKRESVHVI